MAIFVSAGHNPNGIKKDPGAVGNGFREADLTVEFRNLVLGSLLKRGFKGIADDDSETLGQYLKRIITDNGSVVLEFHFDAAINPTATGCTSLIGSDADKNDKHFGNELVEATAQILGIKNRGCISESESHRGRLGLMRERGIVALLEICFITNASDLKKYQDNKFTLADKIAEIIIKYENLIN